MKILRLELNEFYAEWGIRFASTVVLCKRQVQHFATFEVTIIVLKTKPMVVFSGSIRRCLYHIIPLHEPS